VQKGHISQAEGFAKGGIALVPGTSNRVVTLVIILKDPGNQVQVTAGQLGLEQIHDFAWTQAGFSKGGRRVGPGQVRLFDEARKVLINDFSSIKHR
jgi:hypothetical protein